MTNAKTTKRALLASVMAMLLCFTMLIGTTYAWFTDSVTSSGNKIVSGTLDVQLLMHNGTEYADISANTSPIFGEGSIAQDNNAETLWEPGKTQVAYLAIKNNGTLALKYNVALDVTNVRKDLYKVMQYTITPDAQASGVTAWNSAAALSVVPGTQTVAESTKLEPGAIHYFALSIHMLETAGDEYQNGEVDFDLTVLATQLDYENDSFGSDYDADAIDCDVVATPDTFGEILANAQPGDVIGLANGAYFGKVTIPCDNLTLVSNSAVLDSVDLNGKNGIVLDGITFEAMYDQIPTSTYDSGNYTPTGNYASITNTTSTANGANDVVIKNCTFIAYEGAPAYGNYDSTKYIAIDFSDVGRKSGSSTNVTIENCTFKNFADTDTDAADAVNWIRLNYVEGDVVIKGNKFLGATSHHNINATGNDANWVITGNSFNNWADGEYAFGTSRGGSDGIVSINISNNTFNKTMNAGAEIPVLSIKSSYTDANSAITVKGNVANNGYATIDAARRADAKYYMTATAATVANKADFNAAIAATGTDVVVNANGANLGNLNYGLTTSTVPAGKTLTIANADFSNNGACYGNKVNGTVIFENCTFDADVYSIHFDGGTGKVIFNNCTLVGWCSFGSVEVEMNNCTIKGNGTYALIRCYKNATMTNCTFDLSNANTSDNYADRIDCGSANPTNTITLNGCTNVNGAMADICDANAVANGKIVIN